MHLETKARDIILTDMRDVRILRKHIDKEERNIAKPALVLWDKQRELVTVDLAKKALELGTVPPEWEDVWARMIREFVRDEVAPEWIKSISIAGDGIARKINQIQRKQFDFDTTMIGVKAWIDDKGGKLIVDLTRKQLKSVHALLQDQIALGVTSPHILSQRIRPIVGLTNREAKAVARVMASLTEEGIPVARINKQVGNYAKTLHKNRSIRIARTEISNSYNFGQMNSLKQAADTGWLPGPVEKSWLAGGANPCDDCLENEAAGPIALDATFPSNDEHPTAHPACECAISYKVRR